MEKGYADLVLEPFLAEYPGLKYSYFIEIKYSKPPDKKKMAKIGLPHIPTKFSRSNIDNQCGIIYYQVSSSKTKSNKIRVSDMKKNFKGRREIHE